MKVLRTILIALALIVVATLVALWLNPPIGWLLNQGIAVVKHQTGRDLTVSGGRSLKLGLTSTMRLEDVTLGPADGGPGEPLLKARVIEADFELLPLIFRRLEVGRLRAEAPAVALGPVAAPSRAAASSGAELKPPYSIGEVVITDGRLSWRDAPGAAPTVFEGINVKTDRIVAGAPITGTYDLTWRGDKIAGAAEIAAPEALAAGGTSATRFQLSSPRGTIDADGQLTAGGEVRFTGKAAATTKSLREAALWLGQPLPEGKGFAAARANGDVMLDAKRLQLANARIVVDDTTATGTLGVDLPPARLKVTARLSADKLDAGTYVDAAREQSAPAAKRSRTPAFTIEPVPIKESLKAYLAATDAGTPPEAAMLEAAGIPTTRATPEVSSAWSDQPLFDTGALKAADADLDIAVKKVKVKSIEFGLPQLKVALNNGELSLDAPKIETGNGGLGATLKVDARQPVPAVQSTFKLDDLEVRDLLGDMGVESYVAGQVSGEGQFKGMGVSQRDLVRSLDGSLKADIDRGAVVGWDVWSVISNFGRLGPFDESRRVPLDRVRANVTVAKGIAKSQAAEAGGPVLRLRGEATARLPARQLQTEARVSLVPPPILFPIALQVAGPWDGLKLTWGWDSVFGGTRSDPVQSPVGVVEGLDLKDPELAALLRKSIDRAKSTRSPNDASLATMTELLAKAEGR
jgi:AsmA protein